MQKSGGMWRIGGNEGKSLEQVSLDQGLTREHQSASDFREGNWPMQSWDKNRARFSKGCISKEELCFCLGSTLQRLGGQGHLVNHSSSHRRTRNMTGGGVTGTAIENICPV